MPEATRQLSATEPVKPLAADPPPGRSLREFALAQLDVAAGQLAREGTARHAGIHQARKSLRRVRATLALARDALGEPGRRLDRELARLCRGLSSLRDAQALVEALQRLAPTAPPALQAQLPQAVELAVARREERLARALDRDPGFARRRARLEASSSRLAGLPWDRVRKGDVAHAVGRSLRRLSRARKRVLRQPGQDERWHVLRRRLRRLRQQESLLQAVDLALRPADGVPAEEMATALGEAQDDVLLLRHCGPRSPFPPVLRRALRLVACERLDHARAAFAGS